MNWLTVTVKNWTAYYAVDEQGRKRGMAFDSMSVAKGQGALPAEVIKNAVLKYDPHAQFI